MGEGAKVQGGVLTSAALVSGALKLGRCGEGVGLGLRIRIGVIVAEGRGGGKEPVHGGCVPDIWQYGKMSQLETVECFKSTHEEGD